MAEVNGDEEAQPAGTGHDPALEERRVAGAIKTDFILSAEIMAIALAEMPGESIWFQAVALLIVAVGITVAWIVIDKHTQYSSSYVRRSKPHAIALLIAI